MCSFAYLTAFTYYTAQPQTCSTDTFTCSDGSTVSRDPDNNCQFADCPTDSGSGMVEFTTYTDDQCTIAASDPIQMTVSVSRHSQATVSSRQSRHCLITTAHGHAIV